MDNITLNNLPEKLDNDTIAALARMSMEVPVNENWREIVFSGKLSDEDKLKIDLKMCDILDEEKKEKEILLSDEEKREMEESRLRTLKNIEENPHYFYGNMGEPETPQEYRDKYGVWPPGYNKDGDII